MGFVSAQALLLGLMLGVGLWSIASLVWSRVTPPTMAERIAPYLVDVSGVARNMHHPPEVDPLVIAGRIVQPSLQAGLGRLDRLLGGASSQRLKYEQSGRAESFTLFRQRRAGSALVAGVAGMFIGVVVSIPTEIPVLSSALAAFLLGALASLMWMDYRLSAEVKDRHARITEEFPTVIELLGLALAAGDSLPRALARVTRRASGELGREWAGVISRVDQGDQLGECLRASAQRMGAGPVTAFVEHLAQALERGAPLAEVVAAHSADAKAEYSRSLVDKAGKAEVRMLVPMVLLILPVTVIFAVYPGLQALRFDF